MAFDCAGANHQFRQGASDRICCWLAEAGLLNVFRFFKWSIVQRFEFRRNAGVLGGDWY